ncbi:MAG TPA: hypothetical protein VFF94_06330, partial [Novosphingobium sp.]|nr:hypothetical protein [Novosphingobium sp.]
MSVFVLRPALLLAGSALAVGALVVATPVLAQPGWGGGWGRGGFDGPGGWDGPATASGADPREGRVQAESFVAPDGVDLLGRGRIAVQAGPGGSADERQEATFEAAIIDQL